MALFNRKRRCNHKFMDGFGSMGDAVVCVKCGYDKYPEALSFLDSLRNVMHNDGTYGHRLTYPFVVRFKEPITFDTDWSTYSHYFNQGGELVQRLLDTSK